jgi:hypothetical protein
MRPSDSFLGMGRLDALAVDVAVRVPVGPTLDPIWDERFLKMASS